MGDSTPSFSKADNPTARHPSFVTRTLTFLFLPLLNLQLLLYPQQLSYDWGMEAIRPVNNIYDVRNLLTILFYSTLTYTGVHLAKFLQKKYNRQSKISKALPGRVSKVCDNLEIMCNYCKYRRRTEEVSRRPTGEVDLNNNAIGKESFNLNLNFTNQTKVFDKVSNLDSKPWNANCFQCESVIEIYVQKVCLALMSVYMYSAHKNYGNSPFKRRKAKSLESVHEKLFNKEVEMCLTERHDALDKEMKSKLDASNKQSGFEVNAKSEKKKVKNHPETISVSSKGNDSRSSYKDNKCNCSKLQPLLRTSPPKLKHEERLIVILALLIIPCIPASNLFFYVGFVLAERVLYIPSVGYCYLMAYAYSWFQERLKGRKMLVNAVFVFLMLIYSLKTMRRNVDWRNEESLYRSGIGVNPPKCK